MVAAAAAGYVLCFRGFCYWDQMLMVSIERKEKSEIRIEWRIRGIPHHIFFFKRPSSHPRGLRRKKRACRINTWLQQSSHGTVLLWCLYCCALCVVRRIDTCCHLGLYRHTHSLWDAYIKVFQYPARQTKKNAAAAAAAAVHTFKLFHVWILGQEANSPPAL